MQADSRTGIEPSSRQDIADLLVRYATAIDTRDWSLFRTCFSDDCEADYGDIGSWRGVEALAAWMERTHAPFGHTLHRITNQAISAREGGAFARSYVHVILRTPDAAGGVSAYGFYEDELVRGDGDGNGDWKIARRRYTMVHQEALASG